MTDTDVPEIDDWDVPRDSSSVALFSGDAGGLPFDQRRCLVRILKERYLSKDAHPDLWEVLISNEEVLRSRLNDLFLTLHVDRDAEVAYKRQAVPDESQKKFPTLLHDTAYSREETVLLVYLRERFQRERAAGTDPVLVDLEELVDRVAEFRPADTTDIAAETKRANNAVDALRKAGVLHLTAEPDRFTVSPVLDSLLPLPRLKELLDWLRAESGPTPMHEEAEDSNVSGGELDE
ncbi:MAG: hypothetical protein JWO37_1261 [Acidimicrobiales bacterium]|nr:hypothetical protein [Acidimicrobiales bacterium]